MRYTITELKEGFKKHFDIEDTIFNTTPKVFVEEMSGETGFLIASLRGMGRGMSPEEVAEEIIGVYCLNPYTFFDRIGVPKEYVTDETSDRINKFIEVNYGKEAFDFVISLLEVNEPQFVNDVDACEDEYYSEEDH